MQGWLNQNQQKIAIGLGYGLVFLLAFGLGKISASLPNAPEIRIEEQTSGLQDNNTSTVRGLQSESPQSGAAGAANPQSADCAGKIKGNISSSGKIYHLPGGAFYARTNPEMCFDTEAQAQAAGFRKSSR